MFKEPKTWEEALTQAVVAARVYEKIGGRLQFLRWCRAADYVVNFILAGAPVARLDRLRALANRCRNHQPRDVAWASLCSLDPDHIAELKALEAEYPHPGVTNAELKALEAPLEAGVEATNMKALEAKVEAATAKLRSHDGRPSFEARLDELEARLTAHVDGISRRLIDLERSRETAFAQLKHFSTLEGAQAARFSKVEDRIKAVDTGASGNYMSACRRLVDLERARADNFNRVSDVETRLDELERKVDTAADRAADVLVERISGAFRG